MSPLCRLAYLEQLQADNGVEAVCQSWLGNLAMIKGGGLNRFWTDTETHHCDGGNQRLAFEFKSRLKNVRVGKVVNKIQLDSHGVTVFANKGQRFIGTDVVLAVPPTIWKLIRFNPRLPKAYDVQFGRNIKCLLNVRNDCWKPDAPSMSSDGPVDLTWEGTDGRNRSRAGSLHSRAQPMPILAHAGRIASADT